MMIGKGTSKRLAIFLTVSFMLSSFASSALALSPDGEVKNDSPGEDSVDFHMKGDGYQGEKEIQTEQPADDDVVTMIVEFEDNPIIQVPNAVQGKTLTADGLSLQNDMQNIQVNTIKKINSIRTEKKNLISAKYSYTVLFNGMAFDCEYKYLDQISKMDGIKRAYVAGKYELPTPQMNSSSEMVGATAAWDTGLTGEGTTIAVIDTGIDTDHDAFKVEPENAAFSKEYISNILGKYDLNAEKSKPITADDVYVNGKIPFAYDYADSDADPNHNGGSDHGTHVSGIAAGDPADKTMQGIAPKAQILGMKVFSDSSSGAMDDDILAALEDCYYLGVDVINMSLGSPAGFNRRDDDETLTTVYNNLKNAGIDIAVSAGNSYSAAYKNLWESDRSLTSNPDYGIVSSPSSYDTTMSIASAENNFIQSNYFTVGSNKISYNDTAESYDQQHTFKNVFGNQTLDYIIVPNYGEDKDYDGIDVKDKIAVVSRGSISFVSKQETAQAKGSKGIIVYNNEPGTISMAIEEYPIPAISITKASGDILKNSAVNGVGTLTVATETFMAVSEDGGEPSDFSSWGTTAGLTITPDVMAPGGNIYSSKNDNTYGLMSGTSMASPCTAGAMAILKQYIKNKYPSLTASEQRNLINTLIISTAVPASNSDGVKYSPRKQGAGLLNVASAISTKGYITVDGSERPKLELGDDPQQTGVYDLTFNVVNDSDEDISYIIDTTVLTEDIINGGTYKNNDVYLNSQTSRDITKYASIDGNGSAVAVPSKSSKKVSLKISLNDDIKKELSEKFENGIYVEGYVSLKEQTTSEGRHGIDLTVPYLTFYGDWTKAPVIDTGYYWDLLNGEPCWSSQFTNDAGSTITGSFNYYRFGVNPYVGNQPYYSYKSALSPLRKDGYYDKIDLIYTSLLRNARKFTYTIKDAKTDEAYYTKQIDYVSKSVYNDNYQTILPAGSLRDSSIDPWYGTDSSGKDLEEGTTVIVSIDAELDYNGFNSDNNDNCHWEFPVTIDNTAPQIISSEVVDDTLILKVQDNRYAAYVEVYDANDRGLFSEPIGTKIINETEPGVVTEMRFNVAGVDKVYVGVGDYARNEAVSVIDVKTGKISNEDQWEYYVADNKVTITDYIGNDMDIIVPDTLVGLPVVRLDNNAFYNNKAITSITLGKNIESLGEKAINSCSSLANIYVNEENENYMSKNGVLFDKEGKTLVTYPIGKEETSYTVPSGVETISTYAFFRSNLETVILPETLESINDYSFSVSSSLKDINLPSSLKYIGTNAFFTCVSLDKVTIPKGTENVVPSAFAGCSSLPAIDVEEGSLYYTSDNGILFSKDMKVLNTYPLGKGGTEYIIPESVTTVSDYAFYDIGTIETMTVGSNVTSLGAYAFYSMDALKQFNWGDKVADIGERCFYSDKKLTAITLPDSLRVLGNYAFAWCSGITSFDTGSGLKTIGNYSVYYCTGLKNVVIGDSVETIGNYAFYKSSYISDLQLGTSVKTIGANAFSGCSKITSLELPDSLEVIEGYAFNGDKGIKSLNFGKGIKTINSYAFMNCTGITTLEFPESLVTIGNSAFQGCTGLTSVNLLETIKNYGTSCFYGCSKLSKIVIPNGVTKISDTMFGNCSSLESVTLPEGIVEIGNGAFRSCKKISSIKLPESLERIGDSAFYYCSGLGEIIIPDQVTYIGASTFYGCSGLKNIILGKNLKTISNFAFYNCSGITNMIIPDSVESIGFSAFNRCSSMKSIELGKSVEEIGGMAFNYCSSLTEFIVSEENPTFTSREGVLFNKDITILVGYPQGRPDTEYTVPDTVTALGAYAIYSVAAIENVTLPEKLVSMDEHSLASNDKLMAVVIPKNVSSIDTKALFNDKSLGSIDVDENNETYSSVDGVLFNKDKSTLIFYPGGKADDLYVVPDGVTLISTSSFYNCETIKGIDTGNTVNKIGDNAFYGCKSLSKAVLDDSVKNIDFNAFYNCSSLTMVYGAKGVENIGYSAFGSCSALRFISLPSVKMIGESAFAYCSKALTRVTLGADIETIMPGAFRNCKMLKEAYFLGGKPANLGANAFSSVDTQFTVYYDKTYTGAWAPNGETKWDDYEIAPTKFNRVTYVDINHDEILDQYVADGQGAILPDDPVRAGHEFIGWSKDASEVTDDMVIVAQYDGLSEYYKIDSSADGHGTISPSGEISALYGSSVDFAITPDEGYHIKDVIVNGESVGAVENYSLKNVTSDSTIKAVFGMNSVNTEIVKIIGETRYATAAEVSRTGWYSSEYAVIASGESYIDALVAAPLASVYNAPVLLTETDKLTDVTSEELKRLGVKTVFIAGGSGVISNEVQKALVDMNISYMRFDGADRYDTSLKIARFMDKVNGNTNKVYVVGGTAEADAVSIASKAAIEKQPIILVEKDSIPSNTLNWLEKKSLDIAYVVGGEGVVSNAVMDSINEVTAQDISGNRLAGVDRYGTNAAVIKALYGSSSEKVIVASGLSVVDAMVAAPYAAKYDAPIVLADNEVYDSQKDIIDAIIAPHLVQVGGRVTESVVNEIAELLSYVSE